MRIVVFVKHVKYVYAQTGPDPKMNYIGPDDVINIINPLDELAVEEALRLKDKYRDAEVIAVSLGDRYAVGGLRRCLEMGADKAFHIQYDQYDELDSWATAIVLAQLALQVRFQLILCGKESIDTNSGLVGSYVAEILKIPHISGIVKLQKEDGDDRILVHRSVERSNREVMECTIPCLLTVDKGINTPRYPTLPEILRAQERAIEILEPKDLELPVESFGPSLNITRTIKLSRPKPRPRGRKQIDAKLSATERLKLMMKGGDSKENENTTVMEGISDSVFEEMEHILKECGVDFQTND